MLIPFTVENVEDNGIDPPPKNQTKYPNDEKILARILLNNETVDTQDSQGFSPLHRAANLGKLSHFTFQ